MANNFERSLNVALTVSALAIASVLVYRQVRPQRAPTQGAARQSVTLQRDWEKLWDAGTVLGNPEAAVKVVEVIDLECPFCARFNSTLAEVLKGDAKDVAVSYVHLPIPGHRFAMPGALAAECAHAEGTFGRFINLVYRQQDSIGLKSWAEFGSEAGIRDSTRFVRCIAAKQFLKKVEFARDAALAAEVSATPTVLINGWRFAHAPSEQELRAAVKAAKAGHTPEISPGG